METDYISLLIKLFIWGFNLVAKNVDIPDDSTLLTMLRCPNRDDTAQQRRLAKRRAFMVRGYIDRYLHIKEGKSKPDKRKG
jgi:hypothetical protein